MLRNFVRTGLHRLITTKRGDSFPPIRVPKDLARRANQTLGEPLCSKEELARRQGAEKKLAELLRSKKRVEIAREPAPVTVYFEGDRNARIKTRVEELLRSKNIAFKAMDVQNDEAAKNFVVRTAKCKEDELPIVFVASDPVGDYNELVAWDVAGKLHRAVFGAPPS